MVTPNYKELCAELLESLEDQFIGDRRDDPEIVIRARAILSQDHPLVDGQLTDQDIIDAAYRAGFCFPVCWDLNTDPKDWGDCERNAMSTLRAFAQEIINSVTPF
jgi:hypothetical protein